MDERDNLLAEGIRKLGRRTRIFGPNVTIFGQTVRISQLSQKTPVGLQELREGAEGQMRWRAGLRFRALFPLRSALRLRETHFTRPNR